MADGSRCSWLSCKYSLFARQRWINSHAQTQRTIPAWSTNKLGPAACAADCYQDKPIQRWETARTAPWGTCPCGCRTTTACATACEWKKNELLHHSPCNAVALLLCVLARALQHLSGAPFTAAGVELRCVSQNPNQNAQPCNRTRFPSSSNDILCFQRNPPNAPLCTLSATIAHVFFIFFASCPTVCASIVFIRSAPPPTHHQCNRSTSSLRPSASHPWQWAPSSRIA